MRDGDSALHSVALELAGESVLLLGARALYWPARSRVVIADLHLGKSHVFRRAGIAVPQGATEDDLARLSRVLEQTGARELWIVGDVVHGPVHEALWKSAWRRWRQAHAHIGVAAVIGNHDRALSGAGLDIDILGDRQDDGPFTFAHVPHEDTRGRHVIAGHVHPVATVPGIARRWPVFWVQARQTVLPAFSAFTGGYQVRTGRQDAVIACVEGSALRLPGGPGA